ncbi:MAG: hypothetical protein JWN70_6967 [Planctomycetaceae bacterium]|nr:hypothetical protein [Planctomycetaceae bacterium]
MLRWSLAGPYLPLLLLIVCVGCGEVERPELPVFPVSGSILVDGKPPVGAEIRCRPSTPLKDPAKRTIEPFAFVEQDGTFKVGTYLGDDGAPPGEYSLTIVWPVITVEGGEEIRGADRLKGRFDKPDQPIARVTVKPDEDTCIPEILLKTR